MKQDNTSRQNKSCQDIARRMRVGQDKQDKMPPSARLLHSKFEYSLRFVSSADITALNIMSNMKQLNIMVVVVGFLITAD